MFRFDCLRNVLIRLSQGCKMITIVAVLALPGCRSADHGEKAFASDPLFDSVGRSRKPDSSVGFDGLSDKSRQVERDLGVR
jgi:hypothetical protein